MTNKKILIMALTVSLAVSSVNYLARQDVASAQEDSLPDFYLKEARLDTANPQAGEQVLFSAKLKNNGPVTIESWSVRNIVYNPEGEVISDSTGTYYNATEPGEYADYSISPNDPSGWLPQGGFVITEEMGPGEYSYTIMADPDNVLAESDEDNNSQTITFTVSAGESEPPAGEPAPPEEPNPDNPQEEILADEPAPPTPTIKDIFKRISEIKLFQRPQIISQTIETVMHHGKEKKLYIIRGRHFGETGDVKIGDRWLDDYLFRSDELIIILTEASAAGEIFVTKLQEADELLDSDRDDLPDDWEEILGTDIHNPDSDGDGYGDGLEVKHKYHPLQKFKQKYLEVDLSDLE